jgi:tetratricopeptide (TPR) repeat protein
MDCRKPLAFTLFLLLSSAGCTHHAATVPSAATPATVNAAPRSDNLDPDALKRQPKPETFVAFGDFSAREAAAATTPAEQEQYRDRARRAYQEALKADPNNVPALKALAALYATTNDYVPAKESYEAALKLAPRDATLWFALGMTYGRTKDWNLSVDHLARAVELDPENRSYHRYLGFALARAGRNEESLAAFARYEGEAKAHYYLAEMLEHLGQTDLCKTHLTLALAQDPHLTDATQMMVRLTGAPGTTATSAIQTVGYTQEATPTNEPTPVRMPPPPPPMGASSDSTPVEGK